MVYRLKNSDFRPFLGYFGWKSEWFLDMCGRRYRGCILECFRQGKVYPGVWLEMECRDGIDRRDKEIWENRMGWYFVGIIVWIVVQDVQRIKENRIDNWWLWIRKMYWGLGLLPDQRQKWKVCPHLLSAGNAQFPALNRKGQGGILAVLLLSDKVSTGAGNS